MKKSSWIIGGVIVLGIALLVWGSKAGSGGVAAELTQEERDALLATVPSDWARGATSSPQAVLVEYADFQCPACAQYYVPLKQLEEEFGDRVQFVFRHFPLRQIHFNAQLAAQGAEAAGSQGKFFEMHDLLFENQAQWSGYPREQMRELLFTYAEQLGLDKALFEEDLDGSVASDSIAADIDNGLELGVNSTPTFYLNGVRVETPISFDGLRLKILEAVGDITITTDPLLDGAIDSIEIQ